MKTYKILLSLIILIAGAIICGFVDGDILTTGGVIISNVLFVAGVKNAGELKEERARLQGEMQTILDLCKTESRAMKEEEKTKYDDYDKRMDDLDEQIKIQEKAERRAAEMANRVIDKRAANEKNKDKEVRSYNIMTAIRCAVTGQPLEGPEKEMHEEARNEMRKIGQEIQGIGVPSIIMQGGEKRDHSAETTTEGGYTVPTLLKGFIEPLKAKMVMNQLGAQYLTGLTGNIDIPAGGAVTASWEGETDAGAEVSSTFSKKSLAPERLGAYADFSKQLLIQSSYDAQRFVTNEILSAIALAVEAAAINGAGSSDVPEGILNTTGIGAVYAGGAALSTTNANGAAPVWDDLINLVKEVAVDNADMGSLGYLFNPYVVAKLKKTKADTGSGLYVWPAGAKDLNGHKVAITTQVPSNLIKGSGTSLSAMIFGNFNDVLIGQWGGMDIVVDPYTKATTAQVRVTINSWWDVLIRRAESFAACQDAITT